VKGIKKADQEKAEKQYHLKMKENCPITDLIVRSAKNFHDHRPNYQFTPLKLDVKEDNIWNIGYTKMGNNLPLTSFKLDNNKPCLDFASPFSWNEGDEGI